MDAARLRELANLGAEEAGKALAQLLGAAVHRRLPRPVGSPRTHPGATLSAGLDVACAKDEAGAFFTLRGALTGEVAVLFSEDLRRRIGDASPSRRALDLDAALDEWANILVSHAVSALADHLSGAILPSVPSSRRSAAGDWLASTLRDPETVARSVECELTDASGARLCSMVISFGRAGGFGATVS